MLAVPAQDIPTAIQAPQRTWRLKNKDERMNIRDWIFMFMLMLMFMLMFMFMFMFKIEGYGCITRCSMACRTGRIRRKAG